MVRKFATVLLVVALAFLGLPMGMAKAMHNATDTGATMDMTGMAMDMDMPMDGTSAAPPCCPDADQSSNAPCCDLFMGQGCAFQCGAPSSVFMHGSLFALWPLSQGEETLVREFTGLALADASPPLPPPRFSISV